jgi:hypothetical protein
VGNRARSLVVGLEGLDVLLGLFLGVEGPGRPGSSLGLDLPQPVGPLGDVPDLGLLGVVGLGGGVLLRRGFLLRGLGRGLLGLRLLGGRLLGGSFLGGGLLRRGLGGGGLLRGSRFLGLLLLFGLGLLFLRLGFFSSSC